MPAVAEEARMGYTTFYTYADNTPPNSSEIAHPIIHKEAGGACTYTDPVTIAVGWTKRGSQATPDLPFGTFIYIPDLRCYGVVEDLCGDGDTPQDGPCHINEDHPGLFQIDIWLGGKGEDPALVTKCASFLTDEGPTGFEHLLIIDPEPGYAVIEGPLFSQGECREHFGNKIIKSGG